LDGGVLQGLDLDLGHDRLRRLPPGAKVSARTKVGRIPGAIVVAGVAATLSVTMTQWRLTEVDSKLKDKPRPIGGGANGRTMVLVMVLVVVPKLMGRLNLRSERTS